MKINQKYNILFNSMDISHKEEQKDHGKRDLQCTVNHALIGAVGFLFFIQYACASGVKTVQCSVF